MGVERYVVRPNEGSGYGVFDRALNGLIGPGSYGQAEAQAIAERLELLHQRTIAAQKAATSGKPVDPPQPVTAYVTMTIPALLHRWARGAGGWMGEVELLPDRRIWVKAGHLKPCADEPD